MAGRGFDPEFIEQLKSKLDIVEVARKYIPLEQRGDNFWACCPFHREKTPSFSINRPGQFYHCFGCGKGGDVISFVREMESLDFMDACRFLAEQAKIPVPDFRYDSEETKELHRKKERMLAVMKAAARFYAHNLPSAPVHLGYVERRGITPEMRKVFGLGASTNGLDLILHLRKLGFTPEEMKEAGVAVEIRGGLRDFLEGRLIFPIINSLGEVIAFGGRVLEKTDRGKYKNTRDTSLFSKSKSLYNLNRLKQLKNEQGLGEIVIVEGYMDTISLYQAGFRNVVASMGTSLTKEQARILKRYASRVLICYDGDSAGQNATIRGLRLLAAEGIAVRVIALPDDLDPDDLIKQRGADAFRECLENAMPLSDFRLYHLKKNFDLASSEGRRSYVAAALPIVAECESSTEQEELLKRLREETGLTFESLRRDLERVRDGREEAVGAEEETEKTKVEAPSRALVARRFLLASALLGKRYADGYEPNEEDFPSSAHSAIVRYIASQREKGGNLLPSMLYETVAEEDRAELDAVLAVGAVDSLGYEDAKRYFRDCLALVRKERLEEEIAALTALFEGETDLSRRKQYAELLQKKSMELKKQGK